MQSFITYFATHLALVTSLLTFVLMGIASSVGAKKTADTHPLLSAFLSALSSVLLDVVKLVAAGKALWNALFGGQPPNAVATKLQARKLADPEATGPFSSRRHLPYPGTSALRRFALAAAASLCMVACLGVAKTAADADVLQACVVQHAVEDPDPTFETIGIECETDIATVAKDIDNQLAAEQSAADAGTSLAKTTLPSAVAIQMHARLVAVHHADGGAK